MNVMYNINAVIKNTSDVSIFFSNCLIILLIYLSLVKNLLCWEDLLVPHLCFVRVRIGIGIFFLYLH